MWGQGISPQWPVLLSRRLFTPDTLTKQKHNYALTAAAGALTEFSLSIEA